MLPTPEPGQRAVATALCLSLASSLASAQTRRQQQQPDASLPVNARRLAQQALPTAVLITLEGGCYDSNFFLTNGLNTPNKHVINGSRRGTVSITGNRRTFPIAANWSHPRQYLAPMRVIRTDAKPLMLLARGLPPWCASQGNVLLPKIGEGDESRGD